jgi:hypothetical protein
MKKFYVYIYQDPNTHIPFYVGKGSRKRKDWHHCHGWCQHKLRQLTKAGLKPEIITYMDSLSEEDAFRIEKELIAKYGRKDIGTGILFNNTDGGEGASGTKRPPFSIEHRRKLSESKKGKPGYPHSEQFKRALSERLKGKPKSEEQNMKNSLAHKGKKPTDEARRNMSLAWNGRESLEKAHKKAVTVWTGKKHTEESKCKISASLKRYHQNKGELVMAEELVRSNAGEALVAQGMSIVRLENNTQMQVAVARPRDESKILGSALKELDLYPSMAEEALYMKPVGKNPDTKKMTYAEGLSIRTAESLANRWTNSSFGCEIVAEDDFTVQLAGVFLDYENNTRHVVVGRIAKSYKSKTGSIVKRDPDRLELAVKAEQSKVLREVILRSLPAGLKKEYENKVRALLKGGKVENRKSAIVARFEELNVTLSTLEAHREKKIADWTHEDIVALFGIATAMRDGELTKDAAFPEKKENDDKAEVETKIKENANTGKVMDISGTKSTQSQVMAPAPCPNSPETTYTKAHCDNECEKRKDCPAWPNEKTAKGPGF